MVPNGAPLDAIQFAVVGLPFGLTTNLFMWMWVDWGRPWESRGHPWGTLGDLGAEQGAAWLGNWPGEWSGESMGVTEVRA